MKPRTTKHQRRLGKKLKHARIEAAKTPLPQHLQPFSKHYQPNRKQAVRDARHTSINDHIRFHEHLKQLQNQLPTP